MGQRPVIYTLALCLDWLCNMREIKTPLSEEKFDELQRLAVSSR